MQIRIIALLSLVCVAGCAQESRQMPVSSVRPNAAGPASSEPEPANSLPRGSAVNRPLTQPDGNVGSTRVGPATIR